MINPRNRIKRIDTVKVGDILDNPKNFRVHGRQQVGAMGMMMESVGFAAPLIAYENSDSKLVLIDGHLRRSSLPPDYMVPVVVLDVNESEADLILASYDRLSYMADVDNNLLKELFTQVKESIGESQHMLSAVWNNYESIMSECNIDVDLSDIEKLIVESLELDHSASTMDMVTINMPRIVSEKIHDMMSELSPQSAVTSDLPETLSGMLSNITGNEAVVVAIFLGWMRHKGYGRGSNKIFIPVQAKVDDSKILINAIADAIRDDAGVLLASSGVSRKKSVADIVSRMIIERFNDYK